MATLDRKKTILELEKLAKEVLSFKQERELRRPLLIEFCGSPKSGKTTTINSLNIFLKRNDFKTVVLTERAGVCPIVNKTHPFFNIWTLTSAIAEIVKQLDQGKDKVDIIIIDRGIFDALCWFHWLNSNPEKNAPYLDDDSYLTMKQFCFMDMWRSYLDLIYVFKVSPKTSINREYATLLTDTTGSIMNEPVLEGFNNSIEKIIKEYKLKYRNVIEIETDVLNETDNDPNFVSYQVTSNVLNILKELLIEKVGYFNLNISPQFVLSDLKSIENLKVEFDNRDKVEKNMNAIQPIPIAVITNSKRSKVLVVKKSSKRTPSNSPESEKLLLYIGGHVRQEDMNDDSNTFKIIERALHREIQEEIGESISIKNKQPFLIYTTDHPKSERHLAICYVIELDLEDKKFKLTSDEFIMKTGKSKSGHILAIEEVNSKKYKLESWSKEILKKVFKKDNTNPTLFENEYL